MDEKKLEQKHVDWIEEHPDVSWTEGMFASGFWFSLTEDDKITELRDKGHWMPFFVAGLKKHDPEFYNKYRVLIDE